MLAPRSLASVYSVHAFFFLWILLSRFPLSQFPSSRRHASFLAAPHSLGPPPRLPRCGLVGLWVAPARGHWLIRCWPGPAPRPSGCGPAGLWLGPALVAGFLPPPYGDGWTHRLTPTSFLSALARSAVPWLGLHGPRARLSPLGFCSFGLFSFFSALKWWSEGFSRAVGVA